MEYISSMKPRFKNAVCFFFKDIYLQNMGYISSMKSRIKNAFF